jgi:hypothetical protein
MFEVHRHLEHVRGELVIVLLRAKDVGTVEELTHSLGKVVTRALRFVPDPVKDPTEVLAIAIGVQDTLHHENGVCGLVCLGVWPFLMEGVHRDFFSFMDVRCVVFYYST